MGEAVFGLKTFWLPIADGVVNDRIEFSEPVHLIGDGFGLREAAQMGALHRFTLATMDAISSPPPHSIFPVAADMSARSSPRQEGAKIQSPCGAARANTGDTSARFDVMLRQVVRPEPGLLINLFRY
jgi:hypothetical protein